MDNFACMPTMPTHAYAFNASIGIDLHGSDNIPASRSLISPVSDHGFKIRHECQRCAFANIYVYPYTYRTIFWIPPFDIYRDVPISVNVDAILLLSVES